MRYFPLLFFVLNIYTVFYCSAQSNILHLEIKGYNESETQIIDSLGYTKTHSDFKSLTTSVDSLKKQLTTNGYLDIQVSTKKTDSLKYTSTFQLGNLYKHLILYTNSNPTTNNYIKQTGLSIKKDSVVIETAFAKALLEKLTTIAANNGKPFTSFQIQSILKKNSSTLAGNLTITEDVLRKADKIILQGYDKAPKGFIKHYAQIKKGIIFNQEKLIAQNERLNNLSFINTRKDPEVLFTKDSTTVYFYLERQPNNRFDGFLGFATDEETNNLRLDGFLDLLLINNFNYGESLELNYKSDGEDQTQLNITTSLPYLFKSPLGIGAKLKLFRKDSTFSTNEQEASLFYQINSGSRFSLGYQATQSENLLATENTSSENISDYDANKVYGSFEYSQPQSDYFFPNKATFLLKASLGNRTSDVFVENQTQIETNGNYIFNLNPSNSIFINSTTKLLLSENYVLNELFRFGGITSIRGFEENSIFANLLSTLNTEYRYVFNQSLYVHSIIDVAYFENEATSQKTKLYSFGLGTGIRTKAGVFKIIIANGKNENQDFDFANTKLHFQLAVRF